MKSNNTVEINGRRYDARTGLPVESTAKSVLKTAGKFIDGYRPQATKLGGSKSAESSSTSKQSSRAARSASPHASRQIKRSTTLHRSTVKRPSHPTPERAPSAIKKSSGSHSSRAKRADQVIRSSAITRFYKDSIDAVRSTVKPAKKATPASSLPTSTASKSTPSTKERLIGQAIAAATAHEHTHKKTRKTRHFGRYATSAAVALLLVGYVAYLNVPSISMKVAAHRAGFGATMPEYRPSGYSLNGPIAYSAGQVVVNYHSNTDSRKFSLTQQPTTWDSTAVVENYVTKKSPNYLTYQDSGLTIYIFDGSSAAWVNNGKLYHIDGKNSELDADQILKFATNV